MEFEYPPQTIINREDWPPDYVKVMRWRQQQLLRLRADPGLVKGAIEYYKDGARGCIDYINHWGITYDPRNVGTGVIATMPFVLFKRQAEMVEFVVDECISKQESGLIEKSRTMGATWLCVGIADWLWKFHAGAAIGWGSRKTEMVDKIGNPDTIFQKHRVYLRYTPAVFLPEGFNFEEHVHYLKIVNPKNEATITGEGGDHIGRGGRKTFYLKDESAHWEHPEDTEAALLENTLVQIDISSVGPPGNVFHRRRESGVDWYPDAELEPRRVRVFVFDWRDHPARDEDDYKRRKKRAEDEGLQHKFAQEVDRNYYAAVVGIIIPPEWVKSAIDAHIKLGIDVTGGNSAALDVADEGGDSNALSIRKGILLTRLDEWGARDTGETSRRAISMCSEYTPITLQYDSVGVGATVKAEANRLRDERRLPHKLRLVAWSAGAAPQDPNERVVKGDKNSPFNKDFYKNLKAQGWWSLRRRFELTHRAVTDPSFQYDPDELISIDSRLPLLWKLIKELSQPTASQASSSLKLIVDKSPEGTKSPNLADCVMMNYFPVKGSIPIDIPHDVMKRASLPPRADLRKNVLRKAIMRVPRRFR